MSKASYYTLSFSIEPLYALSSDKTLFIGEKKIILRDFQAKVYELFSREVNNKLGIFLDAPTGAGKTYVLLVPLAIKKYDGVVGIYPTKTLAKDQYDSIYNMLEEGKELPLKEIGISRTIKDLLEDKNIKGIFEEKNLPTSEREFITLRRIRVKNSENEEFDRTIMLLLLTSETVETLRLLMGKELKKEVFRELIQNIFSKVDFVTVFTVPEYPYMFHDMSYEEFNREGERLWKLLDHYIEFLKSIEVEKSCKTEINHKLREVINHYRKELNITRDSLREILEIYAGLFRYPIFVDEFHLYSDLSEISLLTLLFMYYGHHSYANVKTIFSSATPNDRLKKIIEVLHDLFNIKTETVRASTFSTGDAEHIIRGRTKVIFYGVSTGTGGITGLLMSQKLVPNVAHEIVSKDPNKKTIVILDRVGLVLDTCKSISEAVGNMKRLIYITSVKVPTKYCKEVNIESLKKGDYDYIIGNLAITQGVDLKYIERGIIYAKDIMSFIQRFGRVPRGRDGEVHVITEWKRLGKIKPLEGKTVSYHDFTDFIKNKRIFPDPTEISWLNTYLGFMKLTFPVFAFILRLAVTYIDAQETKYDVLNNLLPKLITFIEKYFEMLKPDSNLNDFINTIRSKLMVNYVAFYRLMSFRDAPSAKIEIESSAGTFVKEQPLIVSLRNFLMIRKVDLKDVMIKVNLEERELYLPVLLAEKVYPDDENNIFNELKPLNNKVMNLDFLLELLTRYGFVLAQLSKDNTIRSSINVEEIQKRLDKTELGDTPVLLRMKDEKSDDSFEEYVKFMAYTRDALPIGLGRNYKLEKILGIALLI